MHTSVLYGALNAQDAAASMQQHGHVPSHASYEVASHGVVVVTRGSEASFAIECGLRVACPGAELKVHCCHSIEPALQTITREPTGIAFLRCGLPKGAFRKIHDIRAGNPVRIIGVRESEDTLRPIRLIAQRLINAYIHLPVTPSPLRAMMRPAGASPSGHRHP